jgi:hypothetical protein
VASPPDRPCEAAEKFRPAGGVRGAYGRFDLDYWSLLPALRRLEDRIDREEPGRFARNPPSITLCIGFHQELVAPMFRRPWRLEVEPARADFVIESERWRCARKLPVLVIDEVKRFDLSFARVLGRQSKRDGTHDVSSSLKEEAAVSNHPAQLWPGGIV